jgi:DNA-binding LacI/PurR family transcriptional regulator
LRRRGPITIDVVAAEAGVSASTVSHVVNGRGDVARISAATCERVMDAARRLGYAPNHAAQSLRRQRTGIVTVLVFRLSSALYAEIATGVRNVAERRGYHVGVIDAGAIEESPRRACSATCGPACRTAWSSRPAPTPAATWRATRCSN